MANIRIYENGVYINGHRIKSVKEVTYHIESGSTPSFIIETSDSPDIFLDDVYIDVIMTPSNLRAACSLVRSAYEEDTAFREAFLAGIKDVLDHSDGMDTAECAKRIGDRIIGER